LSDAEAPSSACQPADALAAGSLRREVWQGELDESCREQLSTLGKVEVERRR